MLGSAAACTRRRGRLVLALLRASLPLYLPCLHPGSSLPRPSGWCCCSRSGRGADPAQTSLFSRVVSRRVAALAFPGPRCCCHPSNPASTVPAPRRDEWMEAGVHPLQGQQCTSGRITPKGEPCRQNGELSRQMFHCKCPVPVGSQHRPVHPKEHSKALPEVHRPSGDWYLLTPVQQSGGSMHALPCSIFLLPLLPYFNAFYCLFKPKQHHLNTPPPCPGPFKGRTHMPEPTEYFSSPEAAQHPHLAAPNSISTEDRG